MSISEEQRKKDPHAGPGDSFPEDPEHIKAAWDLAGHAKDPEAVRTKILAYAREHNLMDRLPETAREEAKKATSSDMSDLFRMSWEHERDEGDKAQQRRLVAFAQDRQLTHLMPEESHGLMHEMAVPHKHPENQDEYHAHMISKARFISKAWTNDKGTFIEGWVSTEDRDIEHDIVPPEAFQSSMKGYFDRRAPLSSNHAMKSYPVGHLQKSILVRDGVILASFDHPTDSADFEHFPGTGTGWYARAVVNDPDAANAVSRGNLGSFSWYGRVRKAKPLSPKGHRFIEIEPLLEATIAAYPINPQAQITHIEKV